MVLNTVILILIDSILGEAVDIIQYPEYYQQIDTPVDLGTIREDLLGNNYANVQAFHKDMMLVFSNSKQFNQERSTVSKGNMSNIFNDNSQIKTIQLSFQIYAMTCRLQSLYECQIKSILRRRKTRRPARGSSSTPAKRGGRPPPRGSSSSPRKNPRRSTAGKVKHESSEEEDEEEEDEESDEDQEQRNPSRELRTRGSSKRRNSLPNNLPNITANRSRMNNGHHHTSPSTTTTSTTTPSRNGSSRHSESSGASGGRSIRPVKRLRISSGEGSPPPRRNSPLRASHTPNHKTNTAESPLRASPRKHKIVIKNDPDSDEFEDSHDEGNHMPVLDKVKNDDDYHCSDNDSDDYEDGVDVRRSTRTTTKRGHGGNDDYGYGKLISKMLVILRFISIFYILKKRETREGPQKVMPNHKMTPVRMTMVVIKDANSSITLHHLLPLVKAHGVISHPNLPYCAGKFLVRRNLMVMMIMKRMILINPVLRPD